MLSNGVPTLYQEKIVTTVLSNADFVVSNLPPALNGLTFVSVYRNGGLSWTSAPAPMKVVTVLYKDGTSAQFEPTNAIGFFTNAVGIAVRDAAACLRKD